MGYKKAFLSLGSNLGNREQHLKNSAKQLGRSSFLNIHHISSVYRSEPVDGAWGDDFYNMVVMCRYNGDPFELLAEVEACERMEGRKNKGTPSPRTLDIDILFFSREVISTKRLTLPHPRLYHRKFVLMPLAEIAPAYRCPLTEKTISQLLTETDDNSEVEKLDYVIN